MDADEYVDAVKAGASSKQKHQEDSSFYYVKRAYNFFSTGNPNTPPSSNTTASAANVALTSNTVATSRTASPIRARAKHLQFDEKDSGANS